MCVPLTLESELQFYSAFLLLNADDAHMLGFKSLIMAYERAPHGLSGKLSSFLRSFLIPAIELAEV